VGESRTRRRGGRRRAMTMAEASQVCRARRTAGEGEGSGGFDLRNPGLSSLGARADCGCLWVGPVPREGMGARTVTRRRWFSLCR
jgi:hypothetical protein